jgi:hypothetical protein
MRGTNGEPGADGPARSLPGNHLGLAGVEELASGSVLSFLDAGALDAAGFSVVVRFAIGCLVLDFKLISVEVFSIGCHV